MDSRLLDAKCILFCFQYEQAAAASVREAYLPKIFGLGFLNLGFSINAELLSSFSLFLIDSFIPPLRLCFRILLNGPAFNDIGKDKNKNIKRRDFKKK